MGKRRNPEGTKFLRYFGPLLEALRKLGGSGTPDEVVEQVAADMALSDEEQWPASTILTARRQLSWPVEAGVLR